MCEYGSVSDNGRVVDNGRVRDYSSVLLNCEVSGNGEVSGHAVCTDDGRVSDNGKITDRVRVVGNAEVLCDGDVSGSIRVINNARLWQKLSGNSVYFEREAWGIGPLCQRFSEEDRAIEEAAFSGEPFISGPAMVLDNDAAKREEERALISGYTRLLDAEKARIFGDAKVLDDDDASKINNFRSCMTGLDPEPNSDTHRFCLEFLDDGAGDATTEVKAPNLIKRFLSYLLGDANDNPKN